jgi:hypothetical protein
LHAKHPHLKLLVKKMKEEKSKGMPRILMPSKGATKFSKGDEPKR